MKYEINTDEIFKYPLKIYDRFNYHTNARYERRESPDLS